MTTADTLQLSSLADLVQEWRVRTEERARATHSNFNVFTTVLKAHDEVRLHNRFIHNLLDPQGTHDCGDLFLHLFFDTLDEAPDGLESHSYRVRKEAATAHNGQIDLLLESPEMGIAIENKIYAGEQHRQLARYAEYLETHYGKNSLLVFLTLDGKEASRDEGADYLRISYRDHILTWLDKCLAATFSIIPINQVLIQYRHVVRTLTNQTLEDQAMNEIAQHLISNPSLIRMRADFNTGIEEVKKTALDLFAQCLIDEMSPHHPAALREEMTENRFGADAWGSIRLSPLSGAFASTRYQVVIEHCSKWQAIIIGIESQWKRPELTSNETQILSKLDELLEAECAEYDIHKVQPRKTWGGEYWPTGSHDLLQQWFVTDEVIINLLDQGKRAKLAKDVVSQALLYIERLERLHEVAVQSLKEAPATSSD